jgi:hypothetical protein
MVGWKGGGTMNDEERIREIKRNLRQMWRIVKLPNGRFQPQRLVLGLFWRAPWRAWWDFRQARGPDESHRDLVTAWRYAEWAEFYMAMQRATAPTVDSTRHVDHK